MLLYAHILYNAVYNSNSETICDYLNAYFYEM